MSSINPTNNNIGGGGMGGVVQQQPYSNLADLEEARYAEEVKRSLGLCKEGEVTESKTSSNSNNNTQERTHTSDANSSITVSSNYEEEDLDEEMGAMVYKNSETAKARAAAETIEALSATSDMGLKVNAAPLIHVGGRGGGGSSSVGKAKKKRRKINNGDSGDHISAVAISADAVCTMPLLDTLAEVANDLLSPSRRRKLPRRDWKRDKEDKLIDDAVEVLASAHSRLAEDANRASNEEVTHETVVKKQKISHDQRWKLMYEREKNHVEGQRRGLPLQNWVNQQRKEGKKNALTDARINQLLSIGFNFGPQGMLVTLVSIINNQSNADLFWKREWLVRTGSVCTLVFCSAYVYLVYNPMWVSLV